MAGLPLNRDSAFDRRPPGVAQVRRGNLALVNLALAEKAVLKENLPDAGFLAHQAVGAPPPRVALPDSLTPEQREAEKAQRWRRWIA